MNNDLHDFEQFMKRREEASRAWTQGDAELLGQIVTRSSPATFFGPNGDYSQGAEEVASTYEHGASMFEQGSEFNFKILQMAASDGIAYWVGFMQGEARMRGKSEAIPMNLRVTEVFHRENKGWKMVHRHADTLAPQAKD
jgi:ketosteroid isomerase-like protein